jgi:hypothetical protein
MRVTIFEGTPAEYREFLEAQQPGEGQEQPIVDSSDEHMAEPVARDGENMALRDLVAQALTRRPLSPAQRKLFQILREAGPGGITKEDLSTALELTGHQMAGLMGALGRRTQETRGAAELNKRLGLNGGIALMMEITYRGEDTLYRARPELLSALDNVL